MRKIVLLALLTSALPAAARVLPSTSVHVLLDGHREPGVGLHGDARGWRLPITPDRGATDVVLVDETSPTRDKWILPLDGLEEDRAAGNGGGISLLPKSAL